MRQVVKMLAIILGSVVFLGCADNALPDPSPEQEGLKATGGATLATGATMTLDTAAPEPTPEMLAAAAEACEVPTTCPEPKSCGSWSASYDCGEPACRLTKICAENAENCGPYPMPEAKPPFCPPEPGIFQRTQSFRVCFYADGRECTEYRLATHFAGCGC